MHLSSLTGFSCATALLFLLTVSGPAKSAASTDLAEQAIQLKQQQAKQLVSQSQQLTKLLEQACTRQAPDTQSPQLKQAWQQTMLAWVPFQGETIGPVHDLDIAWAMQFWPDKKNLTGRKVNALQDSQSTFSEADISQASVAVQGLGALELLLFEQGISADNCTLSQAIGTHIASNAKRLQQTWQQAKLSYHQPAANQVKHPLSAADRAWISELSHQLSFANKKFHLPLGKGEHVKPYQAESWRSARSMAQLKQSYASLHQLFLSGINRQLQQQGAGQLASEIDQTFTDLLANWPEQASMVSLLQSDQGLAKLYRLRIDIERLTYLIQEAMPVALKIVIGFNATDGD
ncbi:imelysin family protein [Motilimonas eburnea]|uniref:imelysin family protein n=1 Tax=Motilimonas eburnea TaxID=1737488 RepID=UPI001E525681|nr:imelysin family protein [Motilimonas eburnea]MCE2573351.1 imelysin family protein [Motilimonas eburnea]